MRGAHTFHFNIVRVPSVSQLPDFNIDHAIAGWPSLAALKAETISFGNGRKRSPQERLARFSGGTVVPSAETVC